MKNDKNTRQEVNLYTLEFRRSDQAFSASFLVKACCGFFVVLMAIEGLTFWKMLDNQSQLQALQGEQQIVSQRLLVLKQSQIQSQQPKLQLQVSELQKTIQGRKELQSILSGQNFGNFDGFSPVLSSVARKSNGDMSLTKIHLLGGGSYLELKGWVRKPEVVPNYLQRLREEDSFDRVRFGVLKIEKDQNYSNKLLFSLGNDADGPT